MADSKISALTAATTLASTDEFVIATGGASKKMTGAILRVESAWEKAVDESGASLANWTQNSGTWSVVSSAFHVNAGAAQAILKFNTAALSRPYQDHFARFILECEVRIDAVGLAGTDHAGMIWNWDGSSTGGASDAPPAIRLGNNSGTKRIEVEHLAFSALGNEVNAWANDTYHKVRIIHHGALLSVYFNGTWLLNLTNVTNVQGGFLGLYANGIIADFKNVKLWREAFPA